MSKEGISAAVQAIAGNMIELARAVMDDDNVGGNVKVGRNTLRDSALRGDLKSKVSDTGDPVISTLFNHYVVYLEWTRPPRYKRKPPIRVLRDWAQKAGIPTDADTLYRISYAIWRDGHVGRPIFATLDAELDKAYNARWADSLFGAITDDLDNLFND
jgi:hypothetical protein